MVQHREYAWILWKYAKHVAISCSFNRETKLHGITLILSIISDNQRGNANANTNKPKHTCVYAIYIYDMRHFVSSFAPLLVYNQFTVKIYWNGFSGENRVAWSSI